jgi:hypothetical protein
MTRLRLSVPILAIGALLVASTAVNAQFKVVGPAPFPPAAARQKIATLLQNVDAGNRGQTIQTLTGWLGWYRDIIDEELIAAWRKDARSNLPEVVDALADSRVAVAVIQFSWREQRAAAFNYDYAPMFGRLMVRFPESAQPFVDDLLSQPLPNLSEPEAEAVCRILLDMPDVGAWKKNALRILPHYREAAQNVLNQDLRSGDRERSFQAQVWMNDLQLDGPSASSSTAVAQPRMRRRAVSPDYSVSERPPVRPETAPAASAAPAPNLDPPATPAPATLTPRPAVPPVAARPSVAHPPATPYHPPTTPYQGPTSGTLESSGGSIAQNAEYVFRNLPAAKLQLDYDTRNWDARLLPGEGQTQKLILKNKSSGPQKRCSVRWSVIP